MSNAGLLEIRGLTRDYVSRSLFGARHAQRALDDVSLTMRRGEILGIVGESGSGKSTLARLVMALDRPSAGQVLFEGEDVFALPEPELMRRRRHFQMVFQDPFGSLDPRHTIGRIVAEPLHVLEQKPARAEARARVVAMLESVGLDQAIVDRYPHEFSGGQRQRIALARALITRPKLVVADEPVSALDLSVQAQVLNLILDLRDHHGVSFLFISHNLSVVDSVADRVAVMYRGRIVEIGPAEVLFDAPLHPYTRRLAEAEPDIRHFGSDGRRSTSPVSGLATGPGGCAFRDRCPLAMGRCAEERPDLRALSVERDVACHRAEDMAAG